MNKENNQKIALFMPSFSGGGAERVIVTLANGIADKGVKVCLILANARGPYLSEVSSKVKIIDLKAKRVLVSLFPLVKHLKQERPAVLLSTLEHANIIALFAKWLVGNKIKCVIRLTNTMSVDTQHSNSLIEKFVIPLLLKAFYKLADAIIVNSKHTAKDLSAFLGIPSSKINVIYNPIIDDEFFRKSNINLLHPWFVNKSIPVILGVGRLTKQKDFSVLIRAFAVLRKNYAAKLIILGEGEDRKHLEELVASLGIKEDVSLPGFVDNPFPYIKQASVFVLTSRWEGSPNVLIQALALGTPSVAINCPGGVSEILEGNKLGILVPVRDEQKIADALLKCIGFERNFSSTEMKQFRSETIINQYLSLMVLL